MIMSQKTLIIFKPDVFDRDYLRTGTDVLRKELPLPKEFINKIKDLLEKEWFTIEAEKKDKLSREKAIKHYEEHKNSKNDFNWLIDYFTSAEILIWIVSWENVISRCRELVYDIRWEYLDFVKARKNMLHASDSPESARREIKLHFGE